MLILMSTQGNLQRCKEKRRMAPSHGMEQELCYREVTEESATHTELLHTHECR